MVATKQLTKPFPGSLRGPGRIPIKLSKMKQTPLEDNDRLAGTGRGNDDGSLSS